MSELTAQVQQIEEVSIIHLAGYLSSENASALDDAFEQLAKAAKILLVFRAEDMITSAGIAVLFDLILTAQEQGRQVRIAQPAAHFRKVFDLVGLSKDVEIFEDEAEAVAGW
jgi:anti-anti-sigma factor